ncbi:MAG: ATP synthase F1 subunit delta [Acidobacteriota bacterium]|nr:ATP synthase F1 subunit delta [Blastocatellia bacterium]MDW8412723.1 ATP synthase F1 subunit delta [Acidobacteriota bacterium]
MSISAIANRYGRALADIVVESGEHLKVSEELGLFVQMMRESEELREVFSNPTISAREQKAVINAIAEKARSEATTVRFLGVLADNRRLQYLPEVYRAFVKALDVRLGIVEAKVTTARPVSKAHQSKLVDKLKSVTGKDVRAQFLVDPSILGGVVVQVGSQIYDGSVKNQLEQLRTALMRE